MLPYNRKLKEYSQALRKNATKEEKRLWYDFLRNYPIQFQRQKVIGNFIIDFYCDKAKIAIEIDGTQHNEAEAKLYDEERTAELKKFNISVIRFTNQEIRTSFTGVCETIHKAITNRINPHQSPAATASPRGSL
jgi:very-short-patch-repair endonuclease